MASITKINITDTNYQIKDIGAIRNIKLKQGINVSTIYPNEVDGSAELELTSFVNPVHNKNNLGVVKTRTYVNPNETNNLTKKLTNINITEDGTLYTDNILKGILYPDSIGLEDEVADNTINTTVSPDAKYYKKLRYGSIGKSGLVKVSNGSTLKIDSNGYISTEFGETNKFNNLDVETLNNSNTLRNIENYTEVRNNGNVRKFIDNNGLLANLKNFNSNYLINKYFNKELGENISNKLNTLIGANEGLSVDKIVDNKTKDRLKFKLLTEKISNNASSYENNVLYVYIDNDSIDETSKAYMYIKQGNYMVCISAPENKRLETNNIDFTGYSLGE